jgi:hypothetical protein
VLGECLDGINATVALTARRSPERTVADRTRGAASVVWLDLCRPTASDFDMISEEFGLHELAVEDAVGDSQRPKLDHYATHLFLSAYAVALDAEHTTLEISEIAVFITNQALITVQELDGMLFDDRRSQIQAVQRRSFELRKNLVVLRRDHRLLRPEPALPRLRHPLGVRRLDRPHPWPVGTALRRLQAKGLAVSCPVSSGSLQALVGWGGRPV